MAQASAPDSSRTLAFRTVLTKTAERAFTVTGTAIYDGVTWGVNGLFRVERGVNIRAQYTPAPDPYELRAELTLTAADRKPISLFLRSQLDEQGRLALPRGSYSVNLYDSTLQTMFGSVSRP